MIYIRDDDVLLQGKEDPEGKFWRLHEFIRKYNNALHVPAIVCSSLKDFPGTLKRIKEETKLGKMKPEIHGWEHIDYGKYSEDEVRLMLRKCQVWFSKNLGVVPEKFYTPWAANQDHLHKAAKSVGLIAVGGKKNFIEPHKFLDGLAKFEDKCEVAMHWWKNKDKDRLILLLEKHYGKK